MGFTQARPTVELGGAAKLGNEERWVEVSPAYFEARERQASQALWLLPLMFVGMGALLYFVFIRGTHVLDDPGFRQQLIVMGLAVVASMALTPYMNRMARKQLAGFRVGASNDGLSLEFPKRAGPLIGTPLRRVPWRDVCWDGTSLLVRKRQVRMKTPGGDWIFDPEELRKVVLVNIPRGNLLTPNELQMKMVGGWIWLVAVIAVAGIVWMLVATHAI